MSLCRLIDCRKRHGCDIRAHKDSFRVFLTDPSKQRHKRTSETDSFPFIFLYFYTVVRNVSAKRRLSLTAPAPATTPTTARAPNTPLERVVVMAVT